MKVQRIQRSKLYHGEMNEAREETTIFSTGMNYIDCYPSSDEKMRQDGDNNPRGAGEVKDPNRYWTYLTLPNETSIKQSRGDRGRDILMLSVKPLMRSLTTMRRAMISSPFIFAN
jgi:hypothetical protein